MTMTELLNANGIENIEPIGNNCAWRGTYNGHKFFISEAFVRSTIFKKYYYLSIDSKTIITKGKIETIIQKISEIK